MLALFALTGLSLTLSCAARRPAPAAAGAVVTGPGPSPSALVSRPVPAPSGLILVGRVRGYREWLGLTQTPPVMALLERKLAEEEPIFADLDLERPLEFAVVYDRHFRRKAAPPAALEPAAGAGGEPAEDDQAEAEFPSAAPQQVEDSPEDHLLAAVSLPLKRFAPETYAALGYTLTFGNAYAHDGCLITRALGTAPARLMCSDHPDVTRALHDYLARGLPLETLSSSPIFAEFRPGPLKPFWDPAREMLTDKLKMLSALGGPTARAAEEIAVSLLQEADAWVGSLDSVRFEAGPNARGEFQATARLNVNTPEPWLMQSYLAGAAAVKGAPAEFLALPKDLRSAGYDYGIPDARAAALQSAVVQLAKTALKEYGPLSRGVGSTLKAAEKKVMDQVVSEVIRALESPCVRAPYSVWGGGSGAPMPTKRPVPIDVFLRSALGYYLIATPTASRCDAYFDSVLDTVGGVYRALPAKARRELPLSLAFRKTTKLPGLADAKTYRISVSQQALNTWIEESTKKLGAKSERKQPWTRAKTPLVITLFVLQNANGSGSDWFALGLDEKPMKAALERLLHPTPGSTLASRPELAAFLASKPMSLSYGTFQWQSELIQSLLGSEEQAVGLIAGLFDGLTVTATSHVNRRGAGSEAVVDYTLSPEGLKGVRTLLGWDLAQFDALQRLLEQAGENPPPPSEN